MTALALQRPEGFAVGLVEHSAGPDAAELRKQTYCVLKALKQVSAGSSGVFNELQALAQEHATDAKVHNAFLVAQRFLLVLPSSLPLPELAVDAEGEIVLDWTGRRGRMYTVTLRGDGRLSYAARLSAFDSEHGTKKFVDAIPEPVLSLIQKVTRG